MEKVHKTSSRPWIAKRMNVRKFRDDWCDILKSRKEKCHTLKDIVSDTEFAKIEKECSVAAMMCPNQHSIELGTELSIPDNVDLETVRLQKEDLIRRKKDLQYESVVYNYSKYHNYPLQQIAGDSSTSEEYTFQQVKEPDVVLTVQIFRPEKRNSTCTRNSAFRFPIFHIDQQFMVLGCQYLTELRDRIDCISDRAIPGDFSENPNHPPEATCKDLYKSGFFYIDGVFYNDMRHPDCRDYSENILKWAKNKQRGIGPFHKELMEHTKFMDLEIQLGYPYVYVHQGNCEHFIVFSDLVMFSAHHNNNRNRYPLYVALKPKKRVFCMVCHTHSAEWIVYNNKRVPETPFYFCKSCFFSFNYDKNGQKIGNFQAYHHIDRSTIL